MNFKPHFILISIAAVATYLMQFTSNVVGVSVVLLPATPICLAFLIYYGKRMYSSILISGFLIGIIVASTSVLYDYSLSAYLVLGLSVAASTLIQCILGEYLYKKFSDLKIKGALSKPYATILTSLTVALLVYLISTVIFITLQKMTVETSLILSTRLWVHTSVNYIMVLPFTLYLLNIYSKEHDSNSMYLKSMFAVLFVLCVFSIYFIENTNSQRQLSQLRRDSNVAANYLLQEANFVINDLESINSLYESSKYVDENEFILFTKRILKNRKYVSNVFFGYIRNDEKINNVKEVISVKSKKVSPTKGIQNSIHLKYSAVENNKKDSIGRKFKNGVDFLLANKKPLILFDDSENEKSIYFLSQAIKNNTLKPVMIIEVNQKEFFRVISENKNFWNYNIKFLQGERIKEFNKNHVNSEGQKIRHLEYAALVNGADLSVEFTGKIKSTTLINKAEYSYWLMNILLLSFSIGFVSVMLLLIARDANLVDTLKQMKNEVMLRKSTEKRLQVLNRDLEREIFVRTQEMRERNSQLESIFKAFPDVLFRLDSAGIVQSYESGEYSNFYLDERIIVGNNIKEILSNEVAGLFEEKMKKAIKTKKMQTVSYSQFIAGSERSFEARFTNYSPDKILVIVRDVTDLVTMEEKIKEQNLLAIKNAKMVSLGEMAGGIAHEINNPLTIIDGSANIISALIERETFDKEKIHQSVNRISSTVQRIAKIVTGLRKFARDGSQDEFDRVNLFEFVEDSLGLCTERFKYHGVNLKVNMEVDKSFEFEGRGVELSQVLINLLNNAFDAVKGEANKWVELQVYADTDNVFIEVKDSGPGIPKDLKDKIMQPFFTTKEIGVGTGLGLSISKGIIEHHDGRLELDEKSEPTCFRMIFPIHQYAVKKAA